MGNCKRILHAGMTLLYPQRCPVCDEAVPFDEGLVCDDCRKKVRYITSPRCRKCGKQVIEETEVLCEACSRTQHAFSYGYGLYDYQTMKESIYRYKYQARAEYAQYFAKDMYQTLCYEIEQMHADALIPVPLYKERERKRGYNQAALLAKELSKITQIPLCENLIKRVKNTTPQKELDELSRQNNLKKAFHIPTDVVKLSKTIIVDDIYTTGSTIDAVAKELKQHGVGEIFFLTLSIGEGM